MRELEPTSPAKLRRVLSLPLLVCYGVGVTVGAGIFALIGEILRLAGDHAPLSFLLAGLIAGVTGVSYAVLVRRFPRAGGEAVFVNRGMGLLWGRITGYGITATGIISSSVIALAFVGYVQSLLPIPKEILLIGIIGMLAGLACRGVKESVYFAALVTLIEVGTLMIVIAFGVPLFSDMTLVASAFVPDVDTVVLAGVLSGSVIAFFAFIGFEDIENMAEETINPEWTAPRAIFWTLGITVLIYVLLSLTAVLAPDRNAITGSSAPLAVLFEQITGLPGKPVAAAAAIAMVNGILVQIVMASRVLYGMAGEGLAPQWFAKVSPTRHTPTRATLTVTCLILALALFFSLVRLAALTSLVTLCVFALVNLSLFRLGSQPGEETLARYRWWGLFGMIICLGIAGFQVFTGIIGAH
ncbi:APC family permease [Roseibium algae]|uniref:Amino acid permease n=1 Tax=Roseibium algae TaxID=3123038 RepID=A0ABU8TQW9_9HYPH